LKDFFDLSIVT